MTERNILTIMVVIFLERKKVRKLYNKKYQKTYYNRYYVLKNYFIKDTTNFRTYSGRKQRAAGFSI